MKICIAQIKSIRGEVHKNIQHHIEVIHQAIHFGIDLIVFPELSITGYEPELAKQLAVDYKDEMFNPFQQLSDEHTICIGVGMPTKNDDGICISMLIFQANKPQMVYTKRILHADELPYFVSGKDQPFLQIEDKKIALGICYETLQREHFENAVENHAAIYIASVAKPDRGVEKAYIHFPSVAHEFNLPVLMCNCVGFYDNFLSNGSSSIWNNNGELIAQLDDQNQGLLVYNVDIESAEKYPINEI